MVWLMGRGWLDDWMRKAYGSLSMSWGVLVSCACRSLGIGSDVRDSLCLASWRGFGVVAARSGLDVLALSHLVDLPFWQSIECAQLRSYSVLSYEGSCGVVGGGLQRLKLLKSWHSRQWRSKGAALGKAETLLVIYIRVRALYVSGSRDAIDEFSSYALSPFGSRQTLEPHSDI